MPNSYDQIPYLNRAHTFTHPDRLATIASLLGLEPPCLDRCRVLELGCANGRNVLPMAAALPGAHFVGVDLSARQIAEGRADVAEPALAPAADPGRRPAALPSARYEALRSHSVTNAYHRPVRLGTLSWYLLPFLDGSRDVDALVELVMANQTLAVEKAGAELSDLDVKRPLLRAEVSSSLTALARAALIAAQASD